LKHDDGHSQNVAEPLCFQLSTAKTRLAASGWFAPVVVDNGQKGGIA
jgi:hypothetical protein